jgi:ATP-dependent DNA helicase RecQ
VLLFNHGDVRLREFLISSGGSDGPRPESVVAAERERLRTMLAYAYARGCRRAFLLDYFGDEPHRCDGDEGAAHLRCDACAARRDDAPLSDEEHLMVRKVLSCIARVDGRYGRKRIALCLMGSDTREVVDANLHQLSTFGAVRGKSLAYVLDVLGALEAGGLVEAEGDDYPCLRITRAGREVMHDRARPALPLPRGGRAVMPTAGAARAAAAPTAGAADDESPVDGELLGRLKALRTRLAAGEKLPAYCIFHDRTLSALARQRPGSLDEMKTVPGVGPTKLAKYGAAFLEVLLAG